MNTPLSALLKSRRFLPLFVTQFLGAFNDNAFKNALVILITYQLANSLSMNSQILVALSAGVFILPFFLFSAVAGQLADQLDKAYLTRIIKMIEVILMVVGAVGFYFTNITLLMSVLFMLGAHAAFFGPIKYSILPEHLRENELIAGNGLIEAGTFLAILIGTIMGGVLILHSHGIYIISAIMLIAAIVGAIAALFIPKKTIKRKQPYQVSFNFIKETIELIQYSRNSWDIFLSILGISWFWFVGATFIAEFPTFAKDILHANGSIVTLFLAIFSIGLALGSLLTNKLLKGKVHATYVPVGALGMAIFTMDLYFATRNIKLPTSSELINLSQFVFSFSGVRIMIDLLLVSICGGIYTVPLYAILQHRSDKEHCARVIASNNVINSLFMVASALGTSIMLKFGYSVLDVFLVVGLGSVIVAIYICKLLPDVLLRAFFSWLLKLFYNVKISGLENYHAAGKRIVIIANHTSFIDALLLATFLPHRLTFAVNTTIAKKWWVKLMLSLVNTYSVDPTKPMAIKSLIEFVRQDKRCVIFPEGRLTVTGALMKIYEGPGLVADKSNAKLLPIRIDGAQLTPFSRLKDKLRLRFFPTINITIFPAAEMDIAADIKGRKRRHKINYRLYDIMTNMIFDSSDYKKTLFCSLIDAAKNHGFQHTIIEDIERNPMTYRQFIMRCFILGDIVSRSTLPGENVGVLLPNMSSTITTFFALQAFNRVPAMLNYSTGIKNVITACKTAQIKIVYTSERFIQLAKLTDLVAAIKNEDIKICFLEDLRQKVGLFTKLKGLIRARFPSMAYEQININVPERLRRTDATSVILFTSGSEGVPKGVVLSHENIQSNRFQLTACADFTPKDKVFNALPLFHSFGLTGGTILPLLSGIKVFFYPSPLHYRIVPELIYDTNSTIFFATDTFLANYAKYAHQYDFYSLRYVFAGAEKLRPEVFQIWSHKFGVRVLEGYGATEASPVISSNLPLQSKVGTVGRILPGIKYQLIPVPGVAEGGILSVSGPNIMKGYLLADHPGEIIAPENGWYNTGDIVSIDDDGFVTIQGRVKRFAKIAGEMVSLTMVEQEINKLWPIHQNAVINMPDTKKGEQLVLLTTNQNATRQDVINFAKENNLGEIAIPKKIMIVEKMLLLGTGKVDYMGMKAKFMENEAAIGAS